MGNPIGYTVELTEIPVNQTTNERRYFVDVVFEDNSTSNVFSSTNINEVGKYVDEKLNGLELIVF